MRQKTAVKTIAKSFDISPKRSRASIVTFSDSTASLDASLNSFATTSDFENAVSSLSYGRERGDLSQALKLAEEKVFPEARKTVAKIAVIVIDGKEAQNGRWRDSVLSLGKAGVRVLLVVIGSEVDRASLQALVQSDGDVIVIDSFIGLLKNSVEVAKSTCEAASK